MSQTYAVSSTADDIHAAGDGYTAGDIRELRDLLGIPHIELDPWGSVIVSPGKDEHEIAAAVLNYQCVHQLNLPAGCVFVNGLAWIVPDGTGYLMVPDLAVVSPDWERIGDAGVTPAPLLVIEVGSRSTRAADRGRKLADYRLGGASVYLLVETPASFVAHDFVNDTVIRSVGTIDLVVGGHPLHLDLTATAGS